MITRPDDVNNEKYWAYRIDEAEKADNLQFSVYLMNKTNWGIVWDHHKKVINELIPKDAKVLDAGCGYGRVSELFDKDNYIGVDFAPAFIKKAKELYPDKKFIIGKIDNLPFKKHQFDWALCISVKQMIRGKSSQEHWDKIEKELKRVAKKVLILEYGNNDDYEIV